MCCNSLPTAFVNLLCTQLTEIERETWLNAIYGMIRKQTTGSVRGVGGEDPPLVMWPPGSSIAVQVCYLQAAAVYLQALGLCDGISDPTIKANCKKAARINYLDTIAACNEIDA